MPHSRYADPSTYRGLLGKFTSSHTVGNIHDVIRSVRLDIFFSISERATTTNRTFIVLEACSGRYVVKFFILKSFASSKDRKSASVIDRMSILVVSRNFSISSISSNGDRFLLAQSMFKVANFIVLPLVVTGRMSLAFVLLLFDRE